jgi:hypothetical protein
MLSALAIAWNPVPCHCHCSVPMSVLNVVISGVNLVLITSDS